MRLQRLSQLIVMLAICAMVVAEEETLQAEEQTLISYGAYPHAFRYGYGALPYAGLSYAAPAVLPYAAHTAYAYPSTYAGKLLLTLISFSFDTVEIHFRMHRETTLVIQLNLTNELFFTVAAATYNYNFLDTTKEPSAYLPRAYPYVY